MPIDFAEDSVFVGVAFAVAVVIETVVAKVGFAVAGVIIGFVAGVVAGTLSLPNADVDDAEYWCSVLPNNIGMVVWHAPRWDASWHEKCKIRVGWTN